ncbi:MAG TPA: GNAT family N-acetyltransferase [Anaerolineales bacterium]|nr:GNAT family N-acetyltransferase [Anaerolineales bacterium]
MTAAAATGRVPRSGMRPVDPRRDLAGLADVIEIAFADSLDPAGRRMADEMRRYGRWGWLGWLVGHLFLPPAAYPQGYVWIDQGQVVGNASLMPVQGTLGRWVMANVAVRPEFRRRGIARSLVGACLDLARRERVGEVLLQVKTGNLAARELYRRFGFIDYGTRITWRLPGPVRWPEGGGSPSARLRRPNEWQAHFALAQRLAPIGLVWPHPLRASSFRSGSWAAAEPWAHWVWPSDGPVQAALSGRIDSTGSSQLFLLCDPSIRGTAEVPLLELALRGHHHAAVVVETEAGAGDEALLRLGFREDHRLLWMRIGLTPAGREAGP